MGAWNFKKQFADVVRRGEKRQTIRRRRADGRDPRIGERMALYTGMRTSSCRKLGECVVDRRRAIVIELDGEPKRVVVTVDGQRLHPKDIRKIGQADGFASAGELVEWFAKEHDLPFYGYVYNW